MGNGICIDAWTKANISIHRPQDCTPLQIQTPKKKWQEWWRQSGHIQLLANDIIHNIWDVLGSTLIRCVDIQMRNRKISSSKQSLKRTFQRKGRGGRPRISKLDYKPCIISRQIKVLITILILTRLILSVIPLESHPWAIWYTNYSNLYESSLNNKTK